MKKLTGCGSYDNRKPKPKKPPVKQPPKPKIIMGSKYGKVK